jgi:bacterioferritin (cytochrome b1)
VQEAGRGKRGPTEKDVTAIRDEELQHFTLVSQAITQLGGDPTFVTPAADVTGVMGTGLVQVLTDPRTTVEQCLGALLTAELTDHAGWQMLIEMVEAVGMPDLVEGMRRALTTEEQHLMKVEGWLRDLTATRATAKAA